MLFEVGDAKNEFRAENPSLRTTLFSVCMHLVPPTAWNSPAHDFTFVPWFWESPLFVAFGFSPLARVAWLLACMVGPGWMRCYSTRYSNLLAFASGVCLFLRPVRLLFCPCGRFFAISGFSRKWDLRVPRKWIVAGHRFAAFQLTVRGTLLTKRVVRPFRFQSPKSCFARGYACTKRALIALNTTLVTPIIGHRLIFIRVSTNYALTSATFTAQRR